MLATGGAGQIFRTNTNASINTGDGLGMVLRAGIPLEDMEFWQFHPTGVAGKGMLISEAARGEGGILRNNQGEPFMEKYAPNVKDLASRDIVSRAIAIEVKEGRGCGPQKDHVLLDLTHVDSDLILQRLPGIRDISITFSGIDPLENPMPVFPTCHYMMGGIPTNIYGQVLTQDKQGNSEVVKGLYAVGECACVSVHGANRLGGNSLLDIVVFGRKAAQTISDSLKLETRKIELQQLDSQTSKLIQQRIQHWHLASKNTTRSQNQDTIKLIKADLQTIMEEGCGVFRKQDSMQTAIEALPSIVERLQKVSLSDNSNVFNQERLNAFELENLLGVAYATAYSALTREESRGAHSRVDFTERNDKDWLKHSLYFHQDRTVRFKPVNLKPKNHAPFEPKKRVY